MEIKKINLINFRNYEKLEINLNKGMNIFIGNNAEGKTNILESIIMLAITKSHRTTNENEIIKFNKEKAKIKGKVKIDKIVKELGLEISNNKKSIFINKKSIKKVSDYISNLNIISFTPDDLEIIKSSPSVRRNVLNIQLSQLSKTYLNTLNEYNKLLKTRNEYLKILFTNNIADKKYLEIITDKLIEKAVIIYKKRKEYIDLINNNINNIYKEITDNEGLNLKYITNIDIDIFDDINIKNIMKKIYDSNYYKELNYGITLYGPHRDDFSFNIGENDLKLYGSQGQQRISVICYKLSEIDIFSEKCLTKPVLLFDDVFSELDIKRRNRLLKYVNNDIQSIITTTDLKNIKKKYLEDAYIFEVKKGNVARK